MKKIIFDFDGVIVDSFDVCFSVTQMYDPEITKEEYKMMFTGNIFDSINKRGSTKNNPTNFDFFYHYFEKIIDVPPIDDINEFMNGLIDKIIIVSSTDTKPISEYLQKYEPDGYVSEVLGGDVEKSKTIKLQKIKDKYPNHEIYFVTDTLGDIIEGNKVGINCIGVTWGFHDKNLLGKGGAYAIVSNLSELKNLIGK